MSARSVVPTLETLPPMAMRDTPLRRRTSYMCNAIAPRCSTGEIGSCSASEAPPLTAEICGSAAAPVRGGRIVAIVSSVALSGQNGAC
jgi:hypothetical protein